MNTPPMFRLARPDEAPAVVAITAAAYAPYVPIMGAQPVPMTEDYAPRIAAGEVWMLEEAGKPAGLGVFETHPDHLMIFSLAILPDHHGHGLGRALLRFAEDQARDRGVPEIRLYTNALMTRNIGIYSRAGYAETGREPHPRLAGQRIVYMAKRLPG